MTLRLPHTLRLAVVSLFFALIGSSHASGDAFNRSDLHRIEWHIQAAADKVRPTIVALVHREGMGMASGTGTIVTPEGIVLTAAHVVANTDSVDVVFVDGKVAKGKVLGGDATRDVALVQLIEPGPYPYTEMGYSKNLRGGDMVIAMGHAGGFDPRRPAPVRFGRLFDINPNGFLRSDCTLVGGDSGGPLLDLEGRLIGVHSNVGADLTVNNDVPVDLVREDWKRMMAGERWGTPLGKRPLPKLSPKELAGLDVEKFRAKVLASAGATGRLEATPKILRQMLGDAGMEAGRLKEMKDEDLGRFVGQVMSGLARAETRRVPATGPTTAPTTGPSTRPTTLPTSASTQPATPEMASAATRPALPATAPTAGTGLPSSLDPKKLAKILANNRGNGDGRLQVTPQLIGDWLKQAGMSSAEVDALSPNQRAQLLAKALGANLANGPATRPAVSSDALAALVNQDRLILNTLRDDLKRVSRSTVSVLDGDKLLALGTVVRADGFILSKLSEVAKAKKPLKVRLLDGIVLAATQVQSFVDHDLVLLQVKAEGLTPVDLSKKDINTRVGSFVVSPSPSPAEPLLAFGVLSVPARALRESGGYMGVALSEGPLGVSAATVAPKGPAEAAGIKAGDLLLSIDGHPIKVMDDLTRRTRESAPGTKVKLEYRRGDAEPQIVEVTLGDRSKLPSPKDRPGSKQSIGVVTSDVRDKFPSVLQHDQPMQPQEVGGPLLDVDGRFLGINIARAGRIETYTIPASVVAKVLEPVNFTKLLEGQTK